MSDFKTATLVFACAVVLACLANAGCAHGTQTALSPADCAAPIVARYSAKMIAAGCHGEHFNDPQCADIKAQRDAEEEKAGCK